MDYQEEARWRRLWVNEELLLEDAYSAILRDSIVTAVFYDDTERW